jgi:hypothetical protein
MSTERKWPQTKEELDALIKEKLENEFKETIEPFQKEVDEAIDKMAATIIRHIIQAGGSRVEQYSVDIKAPYFHQVYELSIREKLEQKNFESFPALQSFSTSIRFWDGMSTKSSYFTVYFTIQLKDEYYRIKKRPALRDPPLNAAALKAQRRKMEQLKVSRSKNPAETDMTIDRLDSRLDTHLTHEPILSHWTCKDVEIDETYTQSDIEEIKLAFSNYDYIKSVSIDEEGHVVFEFADSIVDSTSVVATK